MLLVGILGMAQEKEENIFKSTWDNGFKIENKDNSINLKFGGRIMYDFGFYNLTTKAEENGYLLFTKNGNEDEGGMNYIFWPQENEEGELDSALLFLSARENLGFIAADAG